jgi:Fe-S-cluster-containing hydrogenase component 2
MSDRMRRILVDARVCSGCRACQVACVAHHEGRFGVATARIRVTKVESLGIDHPHVCRQCRRAPCMGACPVGALRRDPATGAVLVDAELCIGCAACVDACPFGMVALDPARGVALICDLCGGDPACVKRCATGAIRYGDGGEAARQRRERIALDAAERGRDV